MRRLIALLPALLLLAATIPAQAYPLDRQVADCLAHHDFVWGSVTASVKWEYTDTKNEYLLDAFTVHDRCVKHWDQMYFRTSRSNLDFFALYIQPGAHERLGRSVLESLGIYHRTFFRWSIFNGWEQVKPARFAGGPTCTTGAPTPLVGFILADGSVMECPHT